MFSFTVLSSLLERRSCLSLFDAIIVLLFCCIHHSEGKVRGGGSVVSSDVTDAPSKYKFDSINILISNFFTVDFFSGS